MVTKKNENDNTPESVLPSENTELQDQIMPESEDSLASDAVEPIENNSDFLDVDGIVPAEVIAAVQEAGASPDFDPAVDDISLLSEDDPDIAAASLHDPDDDLEIQAGPSTDDDEHEKAEVAPTVEYTREEYNHELETLRHEAKLRRKTKSKNKLVRPGHFAKPNENALHTVEMNDNSRVIDPELQKLRTATTDIYRSYVHKQVLTDPIFSIEPAFDRAVNGKVQYVVIVYHGPYKIKIPEHRFTDTNFNEMLEMYQRKDPSKTLDKVKEIYLNARVGAMIDYVITNLPDVPLEVAQIAGASRLDGMYRRRVHFWFGKTGDGEYFIKEGALVKARILVIARNGIRIEAWGVETFIPSSELRWMRVSDASKLGYHHGDHVVCRITEIQRNESDYSVQFSASVKQVSENPAIKAFDKFSIGGTYAGRVNFIQIPGVNSTSRRLAVFVEVAEGVQCMCPYPNGTNLQNGDQVLLVMGNMDEERHYLYGRIVHVEHNTNPALHY